MGALLARFPGYSLPVAKAAPLPVTRDRGDEDQDKDEDVSIKAYQELVGSLMWAASCTRPDTAFAASFLARRTAEPKQSDMDLALRVVSYLVQTRTSWHRAGRRQGQVPRDLGRFPTGHVERTHAALQPATSPFSSARLSTGLRSAKQPSPRRPWRPSIAHLERTFSGKVGARQAILVQDLFRTGIPEGEDPMPHLSKQQSGKPPLGLADTVPVHLAFFSLPSHPLQRRDTYLHCTPSRRTLHPQGEFGYRPRGCSR
jgi:hypothetical protein